MENGVLAEEREIQQAVRIGFKDHAPEIAALRDMMCPPSAIARAILAIEWDRG